MNDPMDSPLALLAVYCALIMVASLAGGWIPFLIRLTHTRLQVAISFVAGLMLGVGLLHLLPHAWHQLRSIDQTAVGLVAGFVVMFFVQRFLHFHHHDVPDESARLDMAPCKHNEPIPRGESHHQELPLAEHSARRLSWTGAMLGLTVHTLIDGVALAASVQVEHQEAGHGWLVGLGTFLVILLHKPFDAMAIGTLMARERGSNISRHLVNGLFGMMIPAGVVLFHLGAGQLAAATSHFLGGALAFTAGTFLCISASDLLPELQFHAHDRVKLSLALMAGLALSAMIGRFEESGHDWHRPSVPAGETETHAHE